jgi:hypothetical protein
VLENSGATPLVTFTFTGGRVTSFADREDLVQVTITVAGITLSVP